MQLEWTCIALVAICWGGYPLIARAAGYGGPVGTLVLFISGLLPVLLAALSQVSASAHPQERPENWVSPA